jgi:uncharacterized protein
MFGEGTLDVSAFFHAFEVGDYYVVFNKVDLSLRVFPPEQAEAQAVLGTTTDLTDLFRFLPDWNFESIPPRAQHAGADDSRPVLGKLSMTISNACNLSCSYCYAEGGTYYNRGGLMMSRETAFNALNRAASTFSRILHLNFFGGEPTLNADLIEVICEYVFYLHGRGLISDVPSFGITTNAYALDERVIELMAGYQFNATVSLDGPKPVHDAKRLSKTGKGTYDAVVANVQKLVSRGVPVEFECTYSNAHLEQGIDLVALMNFFHEEFGCTTLHAPIVSAGPGSAEFIPLDTCLRLQTDAIRYSVENLRRGIPNAISTATRMLQSLAGGTPIDSYCPAGRSALTINADGGIYACFMLMKHPGFSYGNVNPESSTSPFRIVGGDSSNIIPGMVSEATKQTHPECQRCWAQPLCFGCLGEDLERYGDHVHRSATPGESAFCDYKRAIADTLLHSVAEVQIEAAS